ARGTFEGGGKLGERLVARARAALRYRIAQQAIDELSHDHRRASEIMARIRAVEGFVAEREVGDDVALDRRLEQRPLEPRGVAQVAALDRAIGTETQPDEDVAAESLDQRRALAPLAGLRDVVADRA